MKTATSPSVRRRVCWAQFSLRTLMLLCLVTAIGLAFVPEEAPRGRVLPDGWTILEQRVSHDVSAPDGSSEPTTIRKGRFIVRDSRGRTRCVGQYDNDQATGRWWTYHPNGRQAMRGACRNGLPIGRWQAWYQDGREQANVSFTERSGNGSAAMPTTLREGSARFSDGALKGWFRSNERDGVWAAEGDGRRSCGPYDRGLRHGEWISTDALGQQTKVHYFLGHRIESRQALLETARRGFDSDDSRARHHAANLLAHLGAAGARTLATALDSNDPDHIVLALRSLARMGHNAIAVQSKIERLNNSHDVAIRREVLLTLCQTASPPQRDDKLRELIQLTSSSRHEARWQLVLSLAGMKHVLPELAAALKSSDAACARVAVETLAVILDDNRHRRGTPSSRRRFAAAVELLTEARAYNDSDVAGAAAALVQAVARGEFRYVEPPNLRSGVFSGSMCF